MKNLLHDHVIGIPIGSVTYRVEKSREGPSSELEYHICSASYGSAKPKQNRVDSLIDRMSKIGKKAHGVCEHVKMGRKISETVKGKLSLGSRILQLGGVEKVFERLFSVSEGEKLLNAFQCYLSTTAGPIAGLLFVSDQKVAFCSEKSLTFPSPSGKLIRTPYKVLIPLRKIKRASQSENVNKPAQKYIEIVTVDNFDFWFMGFVSYEKALKHLQQVISSF